MKGRGKGKKKLKVGKKVFAYVPGIRVAVTEASKKNKVSGTIPEAGRNQGNPEDGGIRPAEPMGCGVKREGGCNDKRETTTREYEKGKEEEEVAAQRERDKKTIGFAGHHSKKALKGGVSKTG